MPQQITGYRDLSEDEIALINRIKAMENEVGDLVEEVRLRVGVDQRFVSLRAGSRRRCAPAIRAAE